MVRNAEYSKKRYFFLKKTLKITNRGVYYLKSIWAPVAQLDRASASGVEGHEFESRRVYHFFLPFFASESRFWGIFAFCCRKLQNGANRIKSPSKVRQEFPVRPGDPYSMAVFRPWPQIQERDIRWFFWRFELQLSIRLLRNQWTNSPRRAWSLQGEYRFIPSFSHRSSHWKPPA